MGVRKEDPKGEWAFFIVLLVFLGLVLFIGFFGKHFLSQPPLIKSEQASKETRRE